MQLSSQLLKDAVDAFASLPGIGKKSALRLVLYLVKQPTEKTENFVNAIAVMRQRIKICRRCHNLSDNELCSICSDARRDQPTVMVVESIRDVMAIEETQQYRGVYHVLGGVISPIEGIGPNDIQVMSLIDRVKSGEVKEIIMAISPTIEGETTIFYLSRQLQMYPVVISTLARGISFGSELEYADETTLGRSIAQRVPYKTGE